MMRCENGFGSELKLCDGDRKPARLISQRRVSLTPAGRNSSRFLSVRALTTRIRRDSDRFQAQRVQFLLY